MYQGENVDDRGGYRIVDANTNTVVTGERFDMSLENAEQWAAEEAANKQESELAERANELDMDLRQDSDGFYWLDFVNQTDMRSLGPFDLDEVADRITAAENGFIDNQEAYMENLEGQHRLWVLGSGWLERYSGRYRKSIILLEV